MKTRKQGNALVLTVPRKFGLEEGQEFIAMKSSNGGITYIPKEKNIFVEAFEKNEDLRTEDEFLEDKPVGREMI